MHLLFTNNAEPSSSGPRTSRPRFTAQFFEPLLVQALKILKNPPLSEKIPETEVELVLLDDPAMQAINRETRGLDKPTDVLSFASREQLSACAPYGLPTRPASAVATDYRLSSPSLGQIFISIPAAQRNAREMHQSLEEELRFLFIHGFLHILGYDHQTPDDETEMMTIAYQILGRPPYQSS